MLRLTVSTLVEDAAGDSKPIRRDQQQNGEDAIIKLPSEWRDTLRRLNWFNIIFTVVVPILGMVSTYWVPLITKTMVLALLYYFNTGLGITAGYHRLWSHRSYRASLPLRLYLAAFGAGAMQGSARWWAQEHRVHHRYTDTEKDPYSIRKGLLYSHMGWLLVKQDPEKKGRADVADLDRDPVIVWQHRHYRECAMVMGLVLPTLVCGLGWDDWVGGFVYAGILRTFCFQQATFCVNSLAHWLGEQPFDSRLSPRDHIITALITLGEGYHNFHHEFPSDYRNAVRWYQYDPTKWAIAVWQTLGLTTHLQRFPDNEIEKGRLQQDEKRIARRRRDLHWGVPLAELPVCEWREYVAEVAERGRSLVAVSGVVYDVADFAGRHPGGEALIRGWVGRDATAVFHGGVYEHSNAAQNLLSGMRWAVLRGGGEVESEEDHGPSRRDAQ